MFFFKKTIETKGTKRAMTSNGTAPQSWSKTKVAPQAQHQQADIAAPTACQECHNRSSAPEDKNPSPPSWSRYKSL